MKILNEGCSSLGEQFPASDSSNRDLHVSDRV